MQVTSDYLPTTAKGAYSAINTQIQFTNNYYAPLVVVDFGEDETYTAANTGGAIALPNDWESVAAVEINGQILTPAADPENPQSNEFLHNPYTNTVQVYQNSNSIKVLGSTKQIKFAPPLLLPPYPTLFTSLPLTGAIALNESFEQHPSAQFEFEVVGVSKATIQNTLKPGTEIDLYGIPLRVNSLSLTELPRAIYPDSRVKVSASLGGRWENYLDEICFLRADGKNQLPLNEPFQDPDCVAGGTDSTKDPNSGTTVARLLNKLGINYIGPHLAVVPIPDDTPLDATVNPNGLLGDRLRLANSFVRYSNPQGIQAVPINSTRVWTYQEGDILGEVETSYEANARTSKQRLLGIGNYNPQVDLVNFPSAVTPAPVPVLKGEGATALGFEYPNVEVLGEFSEIKPKEEEKTQGQKPRYVRRETKREERTEGDKTADVVLEGVGTIKTMSLCFDIGGQTKSRSIVTEENGTKIKIVDETWGFAYTAKGIYDDGTQQLLGNPTELWQCIKQTTTEYKYDDRTGYLLSVTTSGYNTVRYREENPQTPETLELDPSDDEYSLYQFFRIPIIGRTSYKLKLFPEYSSDGLFEVIKTCNRDGTSTVEALINPDYAPPYYVQEERSETVAFASRKSIEEGQPDLIVGEESRFQVRREVIEAVYKEKTVGFENGYPIVERGELVTPQKILAYNIEFKAQGQAIASATERVYTEESTGELTQAIRRSPLYTREEPAQDTKQTDTNEQQQFRYLVQSAGYSASDPVAGSESVPLARTFDEALIYLRCKLAIENWRNGFTESLQIGGNLQIRSGDRFNYWCNGEYRQRVVLGVQTQLNILGVVKGIPKITYTTSLSLGPWVNPPVSFAKIPLPKEPKPPTVNILVTNVISDSLGAVLDWANIRSRRNF